MCRLSHLVLLLSGAHLITAHVSAAPNIVFVLVDDLGWSDLGVYGSDLHETPRIDSFAAESKRESGCTPGTLRKRS